jgi:hypothetical protein
MESPKSTEPADGESGLPARPQDSPIPDPLTEEAATALLCEELPTLRREAAAGFWQSRLQRHLDSITQGLSAVTVCLELGLLDEGGSGRQTFRGPIVTIPHLDAPRIIGDYACPASRCARVAHRDLRGRPPVCELTGEPMRFRAQEQPTKNL